MYRYWPVTVTNWGTLAADLAAGDPIPVSLQTDVVSAIQELQWTCKQMLAAQVLLLNMIDSRAKVTISDLEGVA